MSSFALKILAMATMLTDHIGAVLEPQLPAWAFLLCRTVGRLAMPLFCFMIAEGLFHTRDAKRYLLRLTLFALVSEVPYDLVKTGQWLEFTDQNVGFTLLLGFLGILLFDSFAAQGRKGAALVSIIAVASAAYLVRSDYSIFGVYYIFIFYYFRNNHIGRTIALAAGVLLLSADMMLAGAHWRYALISLTAVLAAIPIMLYSNERGRDGKAMRAAFYAFYPLHLMVLYAVRLWAGL
ncbi:MAG: conjugal transfer protein TraX [Oscillospiraceae bacterium]|nr:conjugal transfer protein TraX [Oscillospiraceae bacterium]